MQKGDVIYKQAAIDEILKDKIGSNSLKIMGMLGNGNEALTVNMTCDRHIQLLKNLPSAQPEPTLEQIEEYCHKRCLSIVDNALLHKYAQAEIQPEHLTDDDFETIRIHLSAYKEQLGNQHRWKEAEEYQRIIDRFMRFASAQPEQRWIPCSERLPEEDRRQFSDNVLVSIYNSNDEDEWVDVSQTIGGEWIIELPRYCEIVAWMPLPEPYRKESE